MNTKTQTLQEKRNNDKLRDDLTDRDNEIEDLRSQVEGLTEDAAPFEGVESGDVRYLRGFLIECYEAGLLEGDIEALDICHRWRAANPGRV